MSKKCLGNVLALREDDDARARAALLGHRRRLWEIEGDWGRLWEIGREQLSLGIAAALRATASEFVGDCGRLREIEGDCRRLWEIALRATTSNSSPQPIALPNSAA